MSDLYKAYVWSKCPYCNLRNSTKLDMKQESTTHLITCNLEEGGCDRQYAIRVSWKATTEVMSLRPEYQHTDPFAENVQPVILIDF